MCLLAVYNSCCLCLSLSPSLPLQTVSDCLCHSLSLCFFLCNSITLTHVQIISLTNKHFVFSLPPQHFNIHTNYLSHTHILFLSLPPYYCNTHTNYISYTHTLCFLLLHSITLPHIQIISLLHTNCFFFCLPITLQMISLTQTVSLALSHDLRRII